MLRRKKGKKEGKEKREEPKGPPPISPPRKPRESVNSYVRRKHRYQKKLLRDRRFRIPWGLVIVGVIAFYVLHFVLHIG